MAPGVKKTVLVLEDEPLVRTFLQTVLRRAGFEVLTAASSEGAAELAAGRSIDLLIADVLLEGPDGTEAAQRLGALQPLMRVLFVSGWLEAPALQRVRNSGWPLLMKPFHPAELLQAVDSLLNRSEQPS